MARKSKWSNGKHPLSPIAQKEVYHVGIYLRLSNESEDDFEVNSLGHQYEQCMNFLQQHPELQLCKTYIDNGYTGTNFKRDNFQRMIDDIRQGSINCVMVKDLSRFGRNYLEVDNYLNLLFPMWKVRFIAVCDNLDTKHNDVNNLVIPLKNIFNEYYSRDISQKIKSSIHTRIENQTFIPSSFVIPYGYLRDGENHTFQVDDEVAPIIFRIFTLRSEGQSFASIARTLNQEGIPSAGRLRYLRGQVSSETYANSYWSKDYIRKLTSNPVYIGQRTHGKWVKDSFLSSFRPASPDEQTVIRHAHEPIISEELFDKVQAINRLNTKPLKRGQPQSPISPLIQTLKGRVYCGDCGGKLSVTNAQRAGYTVECGRYLRSAQTKCCSHYLKLERISDIVNAELHRQLALVDAICPHSHGNALSPDSHLITEKQQLDAQRLALEQKRSQLLEDLADGLLERVDYETILQHLNHEYDQLLTKSNSLEQQLAVQAQKAIRLHRWIKAMQRFATSQDADCTLWDSLIEKVLVYSDGKQRTVEIYYHYRDVYSDFTEVKHE